MCIAMLGRTLREIVGRVSEEGKPVEELLDGCGHVEYASRRLWLRAALLLILLALVCVRHHCGAWNGWRHCRKKFVMRFGGELSPKLADLEVPQAHTHYLTLPLSMGQPGYLQAMVTAQAIS
jgi:hypothetical protein